MSSVGIKEAEVNGRTCLTVRPLFDRLHILPLKENLSDVMETVREGKQFAYGYNTQRRTTRGIVIYAGPDVKEVKCGQTVRFSDSCSRELHVDNAREYLIRESDVIEANDQIIGDIILIDPIVPETTTGIVVIPSFRPLIPEDGTIVEMGPGRLLKNGKRITMEIAIGDRVLIPKHSGQEVIKHGKAYLALRYADLMGVIYGIRNVQI